MKTIEIDIDKVKAPESFRSFIKNQEIRRGDHLKLITQMDPEHLSVLVTLVFLIYYKWHKQNQTYGEEFLESLFKEYASVKEAEEAIKRDYGIEVTVEQKDNERQAWIKAGMESFANGYGGDEPDYSMKDIQEPNPSYKPWEKDQ